MKFTAKEKRLPITICYSREKLTFEYNVFKKDFVTDAKIYELMDTFRDSLRAEGFTNLHANADFKDWQRGILDVSKSCVSVGGQFFAIPREKVLETIEEQFRSDDSVKRFTQKIDNLFACVLGEFKDKYTEVLFCK